ncbi:hypothetical protein IQ273_10975 [Nodosilinea sp. LEGE 07298]|nr:hypothetical protein [Nodosilinea sp. LEGE 07298]
MQPPQFSEGHPVGANGDRPAKISYGDRPNAQRSLNGFSYWRSHQP